MSGSFAPTSSVWTPHKIGDILILEYGKALKDYQGGNGKHPVFGTNGKIGATDNYHYDKPSIVIGRKGAYRGVHYANGPFSVIDTAFYTKKKTEDLSTEFLYHWFKCVDINSMDSGSAIPSTSRDEVYDLDISLPPFAEQKAIAAILSSLDDKIDLLHRQNQTLEAMAETLFRQWFVEEAEEDWAEGKLGDEFDFTMGQSPSGGSFNEDGVGVPMFQGNADFGFRFPGERIYTTEPTRFAEPFDTLISVRAPVGAQNMAQVRCCIGRGVAAFRYKSNSGFYTYTYFKLRSMMEEIKQFDNEGTVFGSISKTDFQALVITIPPDYLVVQFESEVKPMNDKIIRNCQQIRTLETLRDTLLPKLMSGEVRVQLNESEAA